MQGLLPESAVQIAFRSPIGKHKNVTAIRIGEGDMVDSRYGSCCGQYLRPPVHRLREVGKCPILSAARYLLRLRVERDKAAALERSDIGRAGFIENQVPRDNAARPVLQDSRKCAGPF